MGTPFRPTVARCMAGLDRLETDGGVRPEQASMSSSSTSARASTRASRALLGGFQEIRGDFQFVEVGPQGLLPPFRGLHGQKIDDPPNWSSSPQGMVSTRG